MFSYKGKNSAWVAATTADILYEFRVTEGDDDNPTAMQVFPAYAIPPIVKAPLRVHFRECLNWSTSWFR